MALTYSTMVPLGTPAHNFNLIGTDDRKYSLSDFQSARVLVLIFMCNHCPYVMATLQRMIDLQNNYDSRSVQLVGINPNDTVKYPDDSMENMKFLTSEKNIPFPYLLDETQEVAKTYEAVCTPDIYVYSQERTLLYRGRIDDNWKEPEKVTQENLKEAIEHILAEKPVFQDQIPSMGCSIKWKP